MKNRPFFCMEAIFKSDFLKVFTGFQIFTRSKWKMELFMNRIRFNFKNRPTGTTVLFRLKTVS